MHALVLSQPLAQRLVPQAGAGRLAVLAGLAVAGSLLLWASAKISIPFWPVPLTLQSLVVLLLAAAYGSRLGVATVLLYLLEGACGLPVFQGTPEKGLGLVYMIGPTGGYLIGFAVAALLVGHLVESGFGKSVIRLFAALAVGDALIFLLGFVWLAWFAMMPNTAVGIGAAAAFKFGVAPFIPGDLVKIALASGLFTAFRRTVTR